MTQNQAEPFFKRLWQAIRQGLTALVKSPVFYIYLVAVVIYLPWFLPNLSEIAPWDETYYIISGRNILDGQLPDLAYGPLLSLFYMINSLPFLNSPFWLIHTNSLGRFLLFSLLFVGTWQVARVFKDRYWPVVLFGFLFVSPFLTQNFEYPADLLFAALSAAALAQAVQFLQSKKISHVWWASFWLGLGMLTRGDALIIFLALSVVVVWAGFKHQPWWRLRHLKRDSAARFSFLMAVPIMLAAGGLSTYQMLTEVSDLSTFLPLMAVGFVTAMVVGYITIRWLLRFLVDHALIYFSIYCFLLGGATILVWIL